MVINSTNQYQQNEQLAPILTELTEHKNYRKSQSDLIKGILKSASFPNSQIYSMFDF